MDDLAQAFKSLGDPTRLQMMGLLVLHEELCVCRFEEALDIGQSKASRHLGYLSNAGLLQSRREGPMVHYAISSELPPEFRVLVEALPEMLGEERLSELRALLHEGDQLRARTGSEAAACHPSCDAGG